jgi:ABC-type sugar transport system substrate-binding protein
MTAFQLRRPALALGLALALGAGPALAQDGEYAVLMKTLSNPFWGAMGMGVEAGAEEAGVKFFAQAVESDQAAEPQLNVCNTMLERQPVAMITAAINSTNLLPCIKTWTAISTTPSCSRRASRSPSTSARTTSPPGRRARSTSPPSSEPRPRARCW